MKKTLSLCLALAMILSIGVASFAISNNFTQSPSVTKPDVEIEWENDEDADTKVEDVSYGERDELSDEEKEIFEDAYESIVDAEDLGDLVPDLEDLDIPTEDLGVSDLIYIDVEGNDPGEITVTITPETIDNVVAVIQYIDGEWVVIDATITDDGKIIIITDKEGPIAIVVDTEAEAPGTSDNTMTYVLIGIMAVSAVVIVVLLATSKKKSK